MTKALPRPTLDASRDAASVRHAIGRAAARTGVDFGYLLNQAKAESGLNPSAQARTSSAAGLYQFIDQSWLATVKEHGAKHGYGWAADAIERAGGRWAVRDGALRSAVFALRKDADAAALMAAEHAQDNGAALTASLGRTVGATDLHFAHFLGLGGATRFLKAVDARPGTTAAALFPREAAANRSVFYARGGQARSLAEVYALMARKIEGPAGTPDAGGSAAVLMADGEALSATPPAAPEVRQASLTVDGDGGDSPLALIQAAQARTAETDLLRPQPGQARLAYMMVLASLRMA